MLLEWMKMSPWFGIQVDESTDFDNKSIQLVDVQCLYQ